MTNNFQDLSEKGVEPCSRSTLLNSNPLQTGSLDPSIFTIPSAFPWPDNGFMPFGSTSMAQPSNSQISSTLSSLSLTAEIENEL